MIDFSQLKTPEEKLIVLFLSVSPPMRQKEIYTILNLNKSKCVKALQRIKIIEKFSEHGVVLYRYPKDTSGIRRTRQPANDRNSRQSRTEKR
ncbi:hypothetical protein FACS189454_02280 [Planctomycetales bacterium]|nr:hypothetical protein FACS189454_02280 [Planctomycetales bacterium]